MVRPSTHGHGCWHQPSTPGPTTDCAQCHGCQVCPSSPCSQYTVGCPGSALPCPTLHSAALPGCCPASAESARLVRKLESAVAKPDEAADEESTKPDRILNQSLNFWLDALKREGLRLGCDVQSTSTVYDYARLPNLEQIWPPLLWVLCCSDNFE